MLHKLACLVLLLPLLVAIAGRDPGVVLELDVTSYVVVVRDLRTGVTGPPVRVALGSPARPTPSGSFVLREVVRNPDWDPGPTARARGARYVPPSREGPLGVAKIPFLGAYALHGGGRPLLIGKPVTLGCLRSQDPELLALLDWLEEQGALGRGRPASSGELRQSFVRPARLVIR